MKKIVFIFLLLGGFIQGTFAQEQMAPNSGALRVSLTDNTPITIALDNRYFHKHGPVLTVGDLPRGKHRLKVYAYSQRERGAYASLLFEGKVRVEEGAMTVFILDPNSGEPNISTDSLGANGTIPPPPNNNATTGNSYNPGQVTPIPANANLMAQDKIDKLKTEVDAKVSDTDKMKLMKKNLSGEQLSTDQVKAMMNWFTFESSKVDFAKWAYAITVDKPNYHSLESQFQYKRSQDNLEKFINDSK